MAEACAFLWKDYQPRSFFWEPIDALRRISLTAIIAVIMPGTSTQLVVAYLLSLGFAVATMLLRPYVHSDDDQLVITAQLATAATFFVALLIKMDLMRPREAGPLLIAIAFVPLVATLYAIRSLCQPKVLKDAASKAGTQVLDTLLDGTLTMTSKKAMLAASPASQKDGQSPRKIYPCVGSEVGGDAVVKKAVDPPEDGASSSSRGDVELEASSAAVPPSGDAAAEPAGS